MRRWRSVTLCDFRDSLSRARFWLVGCCWNFFFFFKSCFVDALSMCKIYFYFRQPLCLYPLCLYPVDTRMILWGVNISTSRKHIILKMRLRWWSLRDGSSKASTFFATVTQTSSYSDKYNYTLSTDEYTRPRQLKGKQLISCDGNCNWLLNSRHMW